ncbi:MAG: hypothetical protein JO049_00830 [Hyphomicrobiales bacterium]|jgi:hypothetical protein|nr:hypothetical protein [Hyphomicrobiales bacterium]
MQMMPKISWPQRVASDAVARDEITSVVLAVTVSSIPAVLIEHSDDARLTDPYFMRTLAYRGARHVSAFGFIPRVMSNENLLARALPLVPATFSFFPLTTVDPYEDPATYNEVRFAASILGKLHARLNKTSLAGKTMRAIARSRPRRGAAPPVCAAIFGCAGARDIDCVGSPAAGRPTTRRTRSKIISAAAAA